MNRTCKLSPNTKQLIGGCCVCLREQEWAENPLVICYGQGCTVVVHKACYGIVNITSGSWLCRKCEFEGSEDKTCKLCPSKDGALKRTEHGGWAHVVCALYIPEIKFENDSTMEPIILKKVPLERYNKICCICESKGRGSKAKIGACMNCNKAGCKNNFHVTCGQAEGLLSEKRGFSGRDAYCGYCPLHRHYHLEADSSAETEQSNPAQEMSSSSLTTYSEPLSGATFHGSKKKKRKKHSRKSIKIVGICQDWTYSPQPVIMDSIVNTGASKSPKSEMEPFTNVLTGVGLVPKQVACKSDVVQANFTEPLLIREVEKNSESNGSRKNAPVDDPSEPSAPLEECTASWIEPSRSETPTSPDGYDSESTLSNTSDFGNNIKYNLDYVFSKISTGENELQSEPNVKPKLKPRRNNKTTQVPHAPLSSPNSAVEKQQRNHFSMEGVGPLLASLQIHRQDNLQLEGHVDHLIQRRDDLLDVKASFSIPLTVQAPNGTGTTGSYTDNSVNVFIRELNGMCVLLSPSSPEMAQSPDGPSRHDLTAGREMSGDRQHQPLTLN